MKINNLVKFVLMACLLFATGCGDEPSSTGSTSTEENGGTTGDGEKGDGENDEKPSGDSEPITTIVGHSFSFLNEEEAIKGISYNIEFRTDNVFVFTIADEVNGKWFVPSINFYNNKNGDITFDAEADGVSFSVTQTTIPYETKRYYVYLSSATINYSDESQNEIANIKVGLHFSGSKNTVYFLFEPSNFKSDVTITPPNLKESDFAGKVWYRDVCQTSYVFLEDHTFITNTYDMLLDPKPYESFGTWEFDEDTQTLMAYGDGSTQYRFINLAQGTYISNKGVEWERTTFDLAFDGRINHFFYGDWISEDNLMLSCSYHEITGSAIPDLPEDPLIRYKKYLYLEGIQEGTYRVKYEGFYVNEYGWQIEGSEFTQYITGTYEIKDCFKSLADQRLVLTGPFTGTFRRANL